MYPCDLLKATKRLSCTNCPFSSYGENCGNFNDVQEVMSELEDMIYKAKELLEIAKKQEDKTMTTELFSQLRHDIIEAGTSIGLGWTDNLGNYYYRTNMTEHLIFHGIEYLRDIYGHIEATPMCWTATEYKLLGIEV